MSGKLALTCAAVCAALAAGVSGALARGSADPGITPTSILLGGTAPLSGSASAFSSVARGAEAYFKYVNARGGVHGRTIDYKYLDDAYNPAQTVQATRQLVESDKVFAIFNSVGTEHNQAIRDYLNQLLVPQLFPATGSTSFGRDYAKYPWTTAGFQPSYQAEGWVYGKYLARTKAGAKVAVIFQNDDYGKDLLAGLKKGLQRSSAKIVAAEPYEVTASDVQSQIAKLKASGANTLMIFATPRFAIQSFVFANKLGWKPLIVNNIVSSASSIMTLASEGGTNKAVVGALSGVYLKDPTDPKWADDPGVKLYRQVLKTYAPGANWKDVYHGYGMSVAYTMVEVLKAAGKNPTRASVMAQTAKLSIASNPFLLPGILVKTTATERFAIEQAQLERWENGKWVAFGALWGYRAS